MLGLKENSHWLFRQIGSLVTLSLFLIMRVFPIKRNKIVACVTQGRRYDDNQRYIVEELHRQYPMADVVWIKDEHYSYELPSWCRCVKRHTLRWIYEYVTAKVWLYNCIVPGYFLKRTGQLYIETWHGGLGIKKVAGDMIEKETDYRSDWFVKYMRNGVKMADVFISNSNHLSRIYRSAFVYSGPIWRCGYPKNDILVKNNPEDGFIAKQELGIPHNNKVLLYAPTWRKIFVSKREINMSFFDLDFDRLEKNLINKFGGEWTLVVKFHPNMRLLKRNIRDSHSNVVDSTDYQDMQRLLIAADVVISDYSSSIFDAALRRIPCFTYATDFEQYKNDERGVYYEMKELPFPYAKNNDELASNIQAFNIDDYIKKWDAFADRMGLNETGHASKDIAEKICDFINLKEVDWDKIAKG